MGAGWGGLLSIMRVYGALDAINDIMETPNGVRGVFTEDEDISRSGFTILKCLTFPPASEQGRGRPAPGIKKVRFRVYEVSGRPGRGGPCVGFTLCFLALVSRGSCKPINTKTRLFTNLSPSPAVPPQGEDTRRAGEAMPTKNHRALGGIPERAKRARHFFYKNTPNTFIPITQ